MFRGSKWEKKIEKCFLEKVELEVDLEGHIIKIRHVEFAGRGGD